MGSKRTPNAVHISAGKAFEIMSRLKEILIVGEDGFQEYGRQSNGARWTDASVGDQFGATASQVARLRADPMFGNGLLRYGRGGPDYGKPRAAPLIDHQTVEDLRKEVASLTAAKAANVESITALTRAVDALNSLNRDLAERMRAVEKRADAAHVEIERLRRVPA